MLLKNPGTAWFKPGLLYITRGPRSFQRRVVRGKGKGQGVAWALAWRP